MPITAQDREALLDAEEAFADPAEERLLEELDLPPGRALVFPGGSWRLARWLAGRGWDVSLLEADPGVLEACGARAGPGVHRVPLDVYGPGELEPLPDHSFDLAVGPGGFEGALTTLAIDSALYGLARVLKPDGRALMAVRHEAPSPEPLREGPRPLPGGRQAWRTSVMEPVPEDDPARPEELSPLIPLVRHRRTYQILDGERIERTVEATDLLRLWEMSEVLQVAHRCLMDVSRRWRNFRDSSTMLDIRVPPPFR